MATPFLKWAGGKRWFVKSYSNLFPKEYKRYLEPFLGSGAVFFYLKPEQAILSDANSHLIECYQSIKDDWKLIAELLDFHHVKHSKEYYYDMRSTCFEDRFERAAKFIYLNRTCYNGIYRENLKGIFNVPMGTKTKVVLDSDDFKTVSEILANVELRHCDFSETISDANAGDFLFVDPPYTVAHNKNGFVKYNQNIFSWKDQERLQAQLLQAKKRGVIIVMTNADHEELHNLYQGFGEYISANRKSVISGKNTGRKSTSEAVFFNK